MKLIRTILGKMILFYDATFTPRVLVQREKAEQISLNAKTKNWALYHLETCPFCVKVRRQLKRYAVEIPMKDVGQDPEAQKELMEGGKQDMVPCLRYVDLFGKTQWMYESSDINEFIESLTWMPNVEAQVK